MRIILFLAFGLLVLQNKNSLVNSVWILKVSKGHNNSLKFKSNNLVLEYDCELNYTFHNTYRISSDTLFMTEKDDSHSEDNGKVTLYKTTYLMRKNTLDLIGKAQLVSGKWKGLKLAFPKNIGYFRVK